MSGSTLVDTDNTRDPYRGVIYVLLAAAVGGSVAAIAALSFVDNPVLVDLAIGLGLAAGCLFGVARSRQPRSVPVDRPEATAATTATTATTATAEMAEADETVKPIDKRDVIAQVRQWLDRRGDLGSFSVAVGAGGLLAIIPALTRENRYEAPSLVHAAVVTALCCLGATLAATAVHYLEDLDPDRLPESRALARGARVLAWMFLGTGMSTGLLWAGLPVAVRAVHAAAVLINVAVCYGLVTAKPPEPDGPQSFPLDLGVLSALGARPNIAASVLDSAERQLGIDLRSTWALAVVRQGLEPLVIALCAIGWLSTSLTLVGPADQALVERFGVPVVGEPLEPGLHVHWPWPIDRALRIPVRRVQRLGVGHEGDESGGPEDVLWARQHAENEYTLVLGNGRDLITVDAAVQFRIADARAWRYHSQNPADALKAIAYRAVMRNTVNRTLTDALSENVVATTKRMRSMIQHDADALGLGVDVLDFTVGGMHPPVAVAPAYQAVVSAEVGKAAAIVNAQASRNQILPAAETGALLSLNDATAQGLTAVSKATGEAASFLILQSQYRAAPEDYVFRRRLEVLEKALAARRFTIVDYRFQRDGGELWVRP